MWSKQQLLDLITEERNKYSTYMQLCTYYAIAPDRVAIAKSSSKIDTLECLLKSM